MAAKATQASHTFLTLIPTTNVAHQPATVEPTRAETAVEGVNVLDAAPKTTRSSSAATSESTVSPRSSIDGGVVGDIKNGGFLRLGI